MSQQAESNILNSHRNCQVPRSLAVLTVGIKKISTLPQLLDDIQLHYHRDSLRNDVDGVLAWGKKPSARIAETFATKYNLRIWRTEDGFLRSIGLGDIDPPLSVVLDDLGIYYDAQSPSRLELLINAQHNEDQKVRARRIIQLWRKHRLSKYNQARDLTTHLETPSVLVIDQTFGDASIHFGLGDPRSFNRMLDAALDEHPGATILLKIHPDVIAGRKCGHFDDLSPGQAQRVKLLISDAHPSGLLEAVDAVYTVTSQMGFEALLWNKPVRCFGMPFYAGWNLTQDELPAPSRRRAVTLEDLVHAALVEYPRYLNPETRRRCEPEQLMEWMGLQRRMRQRFPEKVMAIGFTRWKKPIARAFLSGSSVHFSRTKAPIEQQTAIAIWGCRNQLSKEPSQVIRIEDGFLRSVGLGADLVRPVSWVLDRTGMYYDATRPSDLETVLQTHTFDEALLERARALRSRIVSAGLTKYNVGAQRWQRPAAARRVVLVPGQVETDASIAFGAPGIRRNIDLLKAARAAAPDAYLVYKPHPDVVAGLRKRGELEDRLHTLCDEVVVDVPMHALLHQVDEVHVLTSLTGFEALLRGKRVRCEGLPFYAGWGLTDDTHRCPRRTRQLTLDELVAGALILYPTYISRTTGTFTTPERALDELLEWRTTGASTLPWWRQALRWVLRWRAR